MEFLGLLTVGLLIGMSHAFEPDHLAAVATLVDQKGSKRAIIFRGLYWGVGHTISLFMIGVTIVLLGDVISSKLQSGLELAVGLMIVALGLQAIYRLKRDRVHIHVHEHDGEKHIHLHSHAGEGEKHAMHEHNHLPSKVNMKAMGIGVLHGAAGSAALMVLVAASLQSVSLSIFYIAVFGIGSIIGMGLLTTILSFPMGYLQRGAIWVKPATSIAIGLVAIYIGGHLVIQSYAAF